MTCTTVRYIVINSQFAETFAKLNFTFVLENIFSPFNYIMICFLKIRKF